VLVVEHDPDVVAVADHVVDVGPGGTVIDQAAVATSRRSNIATYTGIAGPIRRLFARANGVSASLFSPNSAGACPECQGLGVVYTDLAFMEGFTAVCPVCKGRRFTDEVLRYTLDGRSIAEVLELTVDQAEAVSRDARIARCSACSRRSGSATSPSGSR
jgi:excinuclease UvrABC ATPase subunit